MKIKSIGINNLRSFKDEAIELDDYTCLVGPNGSGKSTVLCALNIFFRESEGYSIDLNCLCEEDFHCKVTEDPIIITVTFIDLSEEAQKDFADYYRQGQLIVSAIATFDRTTGKAEVKQYGQRLGFEPFKSFFQAVGDNKKVADLKKIYEEIRSTYGNLPQPGSKESMIQALRDYENSIPGDCILIPSEDQFYGFSKGSNRLAKYVQWVYVPAVKDVTVEQMESRTTALGKLLARTVRARINFGGRVKELLEQAQIQYQTMLDENQHALDDISGSLKKKLLDWAHPDAMLRLQWRQDPEKSVRIDEPWAHIIVGEGGFEGELSRLGHGFQRSYLLALLQELSGCDDLGGPRLILGCEEPELYQHPPQARHLLGVLQKLSSGNSQIIVCTHSPYLVSGEKFEQIRIIRKEDARSRVFSVKYQEITNLIAKATGDQPIKPSGYLAKIHQALQPGLSEMFFTTYLILVEGLEDHAFITAYLNLLDLWEEYRRYGCHIVAVGCKSAIIQPLAIAKSLKIPTFVVFDADGDKPDKNGSRAKHEKDNRAILKLCGAANPIPFPDTTYWGDCVTMWNSEIGSIVEADIGKESWNKYCAEADKIYCDAGNLRKNMLHIAVCLTLAWDDGKKSNSLEKLCLRLLELAKQT
jgi:energy-coupling factor transporter ATP-binding protein EcfA2